MSRKLSKKPRRVWMFPGWYKVITSPDRLVDAEGVRCQVLPSRTDRVLWTDPDLTPGERERAIEVAAIRAWESSQVRQQGA
jgi:hypothetical protein